MTVNINNLQEEQKIPLNTLVGSFFNDSLEIQLISVCTSDGFDLHFSSRKKETLEADKIAAIASTLCSISNASAEQISNGRFNIATVESEKGNILFLRTQFLGFECVLCVEGSENMTLGALRFVSQRLAEKIQLLK
jgi:predicted regulator of Ras-like GTPase activity (Roadblock/LC7/MglB family)